MEHIGRFCPLSCQGCVLLVQQLRKNFFHELSLLRQSCEWPISPQGCTYWVWLTKIYDQIGHNSWIQITVIVFSTTSFKNRPDAHMDIHQSSSTTSSMHLFGTLKILPKFKKRWPNLSFISWDISWDNSWHSSPNGSELSSTLVSS